MESLDLAINMQKEQLHILKSNAKSGKLKSSRRLTESITESELDRLEAEDYLKVVRLNSALHVHGGS